MNNSWLAQLNPYDKECKRCGDIADEYYNNQWLCEDCIQDIIDEDEI